MSTVSLNYTEPKIVTSNDLNKRSYVEFYFQNARIREYHGKNVAKRIEPNRAKTINERNQLLTKLHFELKKALDTNDYPIKPTDLSIQPIQIVNKPFYELKGLSSVRLMFEVVRTKLRSGLSKTYKRGLSNAPKLQIKSIRQ